MLGSFKNYFVSYIIEIAKAVLRVELFSTVNAHIPIYSITTSKFLIVIIICSLIYSTDLPECCAIIFREQLFVWVIVHKACAVGFLFTRFEFSAVDSYYFPGVPAKNKLCGTPNTFIQNPTTFASFNYMITKAEFVDTPWRVCGRCELWGSVYCLQNSFSFPASFRKQNKILLIVLVRARSQQSVKQLARVGC